MSLTFRRVGFVLVRTELATKSLTPFFLVLFFLLQCFSETPNSFEDPSSRSTSTTRRVQLLELSLLSPIFKVSLAPLLFLFEL